MTKDKRRVEFIQRYSLFIVKCKMRGIDLMPVSFYRTVDQQHKLFLANKSQLDGIKNRSMHQKWQAIDNYVVNWRDDGTAQLVWDSRDVRYVEMNEIAKTCGLITGYDWSFKDNGHVQLNTDV